MSPTRLTGLAILTIAMAGMPTLRIQAQTISLGGTAVRPGAKATVSATLSSPAGAVGVAAVQFTLSVPTGIVLTPREGPAATAAAKQITCAQATQSMTCILVGFNTTVFTNGAVALFDFTAPSTSPTTAMAFTPSRALAATPDGSAATLAVGPVFTLPILSPCDITGDGITDAADLLAFLALFVAEIGGGSCGLGDVNQNGTCDAIDGQRIVSAAKSGTCLK